VPLANRGRGVGGGLEGCLGGGGSGGGVWRCGWWGVVSVTPNGPCWVAIEAELLVDLFQLGLLPLLACGDTVGASGGGSDGSTFVRQGLVRVPGYVLVGVGQLPIDVKLHCAILLTQDGVSVD
jgi:hypothetical protein